MQHFVPETWERYYYDPSLNPFDLPFVLGLFVLSVFFILLLGVALLDDLFHQTSFEVAFFYLLGLASYCIFLYIFFTYLWVYLAYVGFIGYCTWLMWALSDILCGVFASSENRTVIHMPVVLVAQK